MPIITGLVIFEIMYPNFIQYLVGVAKNEGRFKAKIKATRLTVPAGRNNKLFPKPIYTLVAAKIAASKNPN